MRAINVLPQMLPLFLCMLIGINVLYVASGVRSYGISSIDATAIWMFKAKAFVHENGIPWNTLQDSQYAYQHPQYPLGLPRVLSLGFLLQPGTDGVLSLALYPLIYLGILGLCYICVTRLGFSPTHALVVTYFYSMVGPLLAAAGRHHAGEADIVITLLAWCMVAWLPYVFHSANTRIKFSWLLTLIVIVASQIKMEGVFLVCVLAMLPTPRQTKSLQVICAVTPTILWSTVVRLAHFPSDFGFILPTAPLLWDRFLVISRGYVRETLQFHQWYFLWPFFGVSLFSKTPWTPWIQRTVLIPMLGMSFLFTVVYLTTSLDTYTHLVSSLDRVALQLSPWLIILMCDRIRNFTLFRSRATTHV